VKDSAFRLTGWRCGRWRPDLARGREELSVLVFLHSRLHAAMPISTLVSRQLEIITICPRCRTDANAPLETGTPKLSGERMRRTRGHCMSEAVTLSFFCRAHLPSHANEHRESSI